MKSEEVFLKLPDKDTKYARTGPLNPAFESFLLRYEAFLRTTFATMRLGNKMFVGYLHYKVAEKDFDDFFCELGRMLKYDLVPSYRVEEIKLMLVQKHTIMKMDGWPYNGDESVVTGSDKRKKKDEEDDPMMPKKIFNIKYTTEFYIYNKIAEWLNIPLNKYVEGF